MSPVHRSLSGMMDESIFSLDQVTAVVLQYVPKTSLAVPAQYKSKFFIPANLQKPCCACHSTMNAFRNGVFQKKQPTHHYGEPPKCQCLFASPIP